MGTQVRRVVYVVAELVIAVAMLVGSGSLSLVPGALAQGMHAGRVTPDKGPDTNRFQPVIHAPKLPVTLWHPKRTTRPPKRQPSATQTPTPRGRRDSIRLLLDSQPPSADITGPAGNSETRGQVLVTGTASDSQSGIASVGLLVDGQPAGMAIANTNDPSFDWDTTNITPGAHALTFQATDTAGNVGTSAPVIIYTNGTGEMPYMTFATRTLPDAALGGGHSVSLNAANGNTLVRHMDLSVPDRGPGLVIERTYNALAPTNALFGYGWTSELDEGLVVNSNGTITYRDATGGLRTFRPNGNGGYIAPQGLFAILTKQGDGSFKLTGKDQSTTTFNGAGYLTGVADRHGNGLTVTYNQSLLPTTVTDAAGRTLSITTDSNGHITAIAAPGSRTFGYGYDGSGNLTSYTDPAGIVSKYGYDANHRLTSITLNYQSGAMPDQQTNVQTTLTYDGQVLRRL